MNCKLSPSLLSADFTKLDREIKICEDNNVEYLHIDVMDGMFVPNISIGIPVVKSIRKITDLVLDVHLMIVKPERYIEAFAEAGSDIINIHCHGSVCTVPFIPEIIRIKGSHHCRNRCRRCRGSRCGRRRYGYRKGRGNGRPVFQCFQRLLFFLLLLCAGSKAYKKQRCSAYHYKNRSQYTEQYFQYLSFSSHSVSPLFYTYPS